MLLKDEGKTKIIKLSEREFIIHKKAIPPSLKTMGGSATPNDMFRAGVDVGAKAQLKKVVRWFTHGMHDNNFSEIVYFHPGKDNFCWKGRWVVGVCTGRDNDLICVKPCETTTESERWLSPSGDDPFDALEKAIALLKEVE